MARRWWRGSRTSLCRDWLLISKTSSRYSSTATHTSELLNLCQVILDHRGVVVGEETIELYQPQI